MENLLIIKEFGDLMFLEILNDEMRKRSHLVSDFILEKKQNSSNMEQYDEKKKLLEEFFKSESTFDYQKSIFLKEKIVSTLGF